MENTENGIPKIDYITSFNVTRPITIEEDLNFAIKEYLWRFLKIVDKDSITLASSELFTNNYNKNSLNIVVEAIKSSFNFAILALMNDGTVFGTDQENEYSQVKQFLKDRFVIEEFVIEKEKGVMNIGGTVCSFVIKYYKEYEGNIFSSPMRIHTRVALSDIKNYHTGEVVLKQGYTIHNVDSNIIYNPDVKMDYDLTSIVSKHVESNRSSFELFKRYMVTSLETAEKLNCNACLTKCNHCSECALVYGDCEEDFEYEKIFNKKFKMNDGHFTIENDICELINSSKFNTENSMYEFIINELNCYN